MRFNGKVTPPSRVPIPDTATRVGVWVVTEACASEVAGSFERSKVTSSSRWSMGGVDAGLFGVSTLCEFVDSVGIAQSEDADSAVRPCGFPGDACAEGQDKNAGGGRVIAGCRVKGTELLRSIAGGNGEEATGMCASGQPVRPCSASFWIGSDRSVFEVPGVGLSTVMASSANDTAGDLDISTAAGLTVSPERTVTLASEVTGEGDTCTIKGTTVLDSFRRPSDEGLEAGEGRGGC